MRYEVHDMRTPTQRKTMNMLVVGMDPFLSGWGPARHGLSFAAWACHSADLPWVHQWVLDRDDINGVQVVHDGEFEDERCVHLSIYPVDENHPAMRGAS